MCIAGTRFLQIAGFHWKVPGTLVVPRREKHALRLEVDGLTGAGTGPTLALAGALLRVLSVEQLASLDTIPFRFKDT